MTNELTTTAPGPLTVGDTAERLALAREFMATVMEEGIDKDYARIPGCGPKPSLLKPGAEKLARLFNCSVVDHERTLLERDDDGAYIAAYRCTIAGPDGRVWGAREAFASEKEQTFARQKESGPALLNALTSRAQKRAHVGAVIQALGLSDLFAGDMTGAADLLTETQRDIVAAIYARVAPSLVDGVMRQATKVKQSQWERYLGSAIDLAGDTLGWDATDRARATKQLSDEFASVATVADVFGDVIDAEAVVVDQ